MQKRHDKKIEVKNDKERDPDQAWYWTPEWQKAEREAEEEIQAGRVDEHETGEDFLKALQDITDEE